MKKLIVLIAVLLTTVFALPANAAGSTATVEAVGTVAVGESVTFSGCGYTPGTGVLVGVTTPQAIASTGGLADSNGCFESTSSFTLLSGDYVVKTYVADKNGRYNWNKPLATLRFTL